MDDLIAMASIVQGPHARWLDVISRINSPENVARQQRLKQLDIEIENILKFSRADTQGHVDAGPIKTLVREQSRLEEEVEKDTKLYEQELQEARAEMNAASLIGAQSTPSVPTRSISQRDPSPETEKSKRPAKRRWRSESFFTQGRQIEFNRVFQNGTPYQRYRIVEFPCSSGCWYILECTSCSTYFISEDAFQEAKQHLKKRHSKKSWVSEARVLEELGTVVMNCNAELAKKNNALLDDSRSLSSNTQSIADPEPEAHGEENVEEEPPQAQATTSTQSRTKRKRGRPKASVYQWKPPTSFAELDPGIVNLKPGDIVGVWFEKPKRFEPTMILPWGRFRRFNYSHTLATVGLNENIPSCYDDAESDNKAPRPWAPGYGNIGDLAHRRMLPGLYFRKQEDFPVGCQSSWLALNKLKIFDETCPHTINKEAVLEYLDCYAECYPHGEDQDHHPKIDNSAEDGSVRAHEADENEKGGKGEEDTDREIKTEWGVGDHVWRMGEAGVRRVQLVRSVES
ncbi:hypothetical protein QYS62_001930 [Fusarium acuminatum]|uniref:C2H2-type domain-containing protein n=1 Tax=Fusarium acuminatum TaxID=5515 RepID=A0ABZ2WMD3_9HYPO